MSFKVGVEIECENVERLIPDDYFRHVHEAMLVDGAEYVLREPLMEPELSNAITGLMDKFTDEAFSQRCSTHIHIDVREMSRVQLFNFITLYVMFEHVILKLVKEDRVGNLFCLPVFDSHATEAILIELAIKAVDIKELRMDDWKYSAINLASVAKLGSLEFRALHGTKSPVELINWIGVHKKLAEYAMKEELTPDKLIMESSVGGNTEEFKLVMGELFPVFSDILTDEELDGLIYKGVRNAQYFAFSGDWT